MFEGRGGGEMSAHRCPFKKACPFKDACGDHKWLYFWIIWAALLFGVGFVALTFWRGRLV